MKRSVTELSVGGEVVLVRVDFNVPMEDGRIIDDARIRAALPTLVWLRDHGARILVLSHLGRPKGEWKDEFSTKPVAARLGELMGVPVSWVPDLAGDKARELAERLGAGEIGMIENVRFDPREEKDDDTFARELADLGTLYCNDAFGCAHRAHASTVGIARHLPACMGLLMEEELQFLTPLITKPEHPYVALLGGAKISTKLAVVERLFTHVDSLFIGGAMACTFLAAQGIEVGRSLVERDQLDAARRILHEASSRGIRFELPRDVVVTTDIETASAVATVPVHGIPRDSMVADVGPLTVQAVKTALVSAKTVVWNGPFGVYEHPPFGEGTLGIANAFSSCGGTTVLGGGDVVASLEGTDAIAHFTHVSTGGGATIEFLEGKSLPGIAILPDAVESNA